MQNVANVMTRENFDVSVKFKFNIKYKFNFDV